MDNTAMKGMIEGRNDKALKDLYKIKDKAKITTPMSSFLNAIMISNPNSDMKGIQRLLQVVNLQMDDTDFLDSEKVRNKLAEFAQQSEVI